MMGSENDFFIYNVFQKFLKFFNHNRYMQELYLPFCHLIETNKSILHSFKNCHQLISIKDDTMDYDLLNDQNIDCLLDNKKKQCLLTFKECHIIAHHQCSINIMNPLKIYLPTCLAQLISRFVGFIPDLEAWSKP